MTYFNWIGNLNCYVEATLKGFIKFRSLENNGECFFLLPTTSQERIENVKCIGDLLTIVSRDGSM